jgi:hypothetical protein
MKSSVRRTSWSYFTIGKSGKRDKVKSRANPFMITSNNDEISRRTENSTRAMEAAVNLTGDHTESKLDSSFMILFGSDASPILMPS